mmetsp:Transcript_27244/g.63924  ORF Transcript_27244/g.63924 Transcript_27244/m.63924 type:complete len:256 (+) Transcript_27244:48-815(+)
MKTAEGSRPATRDGSLSPAGIAVMLFIGTLFALAPRMGWESSAYGLDTFTAAFLATLVVTGITFVARRNSVGDRCRSGSTRPHADVARLKHGSIQQEGPAPEVDARAEHVDCKANSNAGAASPQRRPAQIHRMAPAGGEPSEEDPVWNADWATLMPSSGQSAEVFEMNDTPTWLARLQHRRDQAERAGKKRLVQRIDKEMAMAEAASKSRSPAKDAAARPEAGADGQASSHDDVWSLDWADCSPKDHPAPAVAAA